MPPNHTTPARLVFIVVCTAAGLSVAFILSMIALLFVKPAGAIDDKVFSALVTAGSSTLSFLFGVLVNTRAQPPGAESSTTTTTTVSETPIGATPIPPVTPVIEP